MTSHDFDRFFYSHRHKKSGNPPTPNQSYANLVFQDHTSDTCGQFLSDYLIRKRRGERGGVSGIRGADIYVDQVLKKTCQFKKFSLNTEIKNSLKTL